MISSQKGANLPSRLRGPLICRREAAVWGAGVCTKVVSHEPRRGGSKGVFTAPRRYKARSRRSHRLVSTPEGKRRRTIPLACILRRQHKLLDLARPIHPKAPPSRTNQPTSLTHGVRRQPIVHRERRGRTQDEIRGASPAAIEAHADAAVSRNNPRW